jgi:DNA repair protein RadC
MKKQITVAEIQVSYHPARANKPHIKSSQDVYDQLLPFFPSSTIALQETFVAGYLNRANRLMGVYVLSRGGITGTVADPRLILSVALKAAATAIILAHNHPSENLKPSRADEEITKKIKTAAELMDITLLDHLILSPDGRYFSFADEVLL